MVTTACSPSSCSNHSWSLGAIGDTISADFSERSSMILGMNGGPLRERRMWAAYLWKQQRHWAIVLQAASRPFHARAVDDFMHSPKHCCNVEVSSNHFFLVYELLLPGGLPELMVSVKLDFDPERHCVDPLGSIGIISFEEIGAKALAVVESYRCYSLVGSNCQHFAKDFASRLDTPVPFTPEDEAAAASAWHNAEKVSLVSGGVSVACIGAIVAPDATALTASAYVASQVAFGSSVPLVATAIGATAVGLGAGIVLGSVSAGYCLLHAGLRTGEDDSRLSQEQHRHLEDD